MTVSELFAALARRWLLLTLGLGVTIVAVMAAGRVEPVYRAQVAVTLVPPSTTPAANGLVDSSHALIAMAGLIAREMQGNDTPPAVSDKVDITGMGIRDGVVVRLPNDGGQWEPDFDRPVVEVQVAGSDPLAVEARTAVVVDRVKAVLAQQQAEDGIAPQSRIAASTLTTHVRPVQVVGSPTRAEAMTGLLGLGLSTALCVLFDQQVPRLSALLRRSRRRGSRPHATARVVPDVS